MAGPRAAGTRLLGPVLLPLLTVVVAVVAVRWQLSAVPLSAVALRSAAHAASAVAGVVVVWVAAAVTAGLHLCAYAARTHLVACDAGPVNPHLPLLLQLLEWSLRVKVVVLVSVERRIDVVAAGLSLATWMTVLLALRTTMSQACGSNTADTHPAMISPLSSG
eukprot:1490374-Amphidinium_carterae.1